MIESMKRYWQLAKDALSHEKEHPPVERTNAETEFLPAALEVLETAPSPFCRLLMLTICAAFFVAIGISAFGQLDTEAVAEGKIIPVGQVKTIQSLITGRVDKVLVKEGEKVKAGQLLIKLNPVESVADVSALKSNLLANQLNESRIHCLLDRINGELSGHVDFKHYVRDQIILITSPDDDQWLQQQQLLDFDYAAFSSNDKAMNDAINQKKASIEVSQAEIKRSNLLVPLYEEQEKNVFNLYQKAHVSKTEWLAVREKQVSASQLLIVEKSRLTEASAALAATVSERDKQNYNFQQARMQQLNEYSEKIEELEQALNKANERENQIYITAPVSGSVQHLDIHYEGAVVEPAKPLMIIVPDSAELQVEAMIQNKDIGFVQEGMHVDIKIESFPYTFYGYLEGSVQSISRDAVVIPEQGLVYPAYISINQQSVVIDGQEQPLQAGMAVSAEVKTGTRSVLEFFIEPFLRYRDEAFNVR